MSSSTIDISQISEYLTAKHIGLLVALIIVISLVFGKKRPKNAPPTAHVGLPVIGNYIEFASNPVKFVKTCLDKFGPIYTVPMAHKRLTFLLGPEVSEPFFKLQDEYMSQPEVYGFMTPVFGKGVVYDATPEKRNKQYQGMAHGLRAQPLRSYVPKIEKETLDYLKRWKNEGEVNLLDALSELTILTASRCLHGDDVREELFEDIARTYYDLDKGVQPLSFFWPNAPTKAHAQRDKARKEMVSIFSKVIKARRSKTAKELEKNTDVLQVFLDLKYKDGSSLTDDEVVGLLIALLFAGQHTSSITSTWTTMFLMHNSRCLEEVMKEQKAVFSKKETGPKDLTSTIEFDDVAKMEYLENCVKESLRMHPPLILLMRMAMKDIETTHNGQKFTIPKGDIVLTSPAVASRMDNVFKNPNAFEPERFAEPRREDKTPYAYLGFGGGHHACKGAMFGLLQVKTIVSILLRNFSIEPVEKEFPEPDYTAMVVGPKNRLMVRYKKLPTSIIP